VPLLRASFEGKATEVINSVEFSNSGYLVAWDALMSRFNNSKLLIHNHLRAIFSLEMINNESSSKIRRNRQASCVGSKVSCYFCNNEHSIYYCEKFIKLSQESKFKFIRSEKLCKNCLRNNHFGKRCNMGPCRKCMADHNTLLHLDKTNSGDKMVACETSTQVSQENDHNLLSSVLWMHAVHFLYFCLLQELKFLVKIIKFTMRVRY
ncbi:hypothetical protein HUJ04_011028, partial [Dendroctonus ponderosae]